MKLNFSIKQTSLLDTLALAQSICGRKSTLESTACVYFQVQSGSKEVLLRCTDLEVSLQSSLAAETEAEQDGSFLVHGKRLFEIVKDLGGLLDFSYDGKKVFIQSNDASELDLSLATMEAESFPAFPENIENLMYVETSFLRNTLSHLLPLTPQNNANPAINGILIECDKESIALVSTDGHSLARMINPAFSSAKEFNLTLPKRSAAELKKALDIAHNSNCAQIFLGLCQGQLVFSGENFNFFTRVINDKFPNYKAALTMDSFYQGSVRAGEITPSLRRSSHLLSGKFMPTTFAFKDKSKLNLELENKEVGRLKESVSLDRFEGEDLDVKFYAPYILSALQSFTKPDIEFFIKSKSQPIFFVEKDKDSTFTYLVMPVVTDQNQA